MMLDSDRTTVAIQPHVDGFLSSFETYLRSHDLRCPPPTISVSDHSKYYDCLDLFPDDDLCVDPNRGYSFIPSGTCQYWHFDRSFPLANACQIWRLIDTKISRFDMKEWIRRRKRSERLANEDGLDFEILQKLKLARSSRESLPSAAFYVIFSGMGKQSKTEQKKLRQHFHGVAFSHEPDPIMAMVTAQAFGPFSIGKALIRELIGTA